MKLRNTNIICRLFTGTKKKLRVKRKTFDADGKISREDKDLDIPVKAGMKAGSKFKFKGVGDEIDGSKQDLHFIIEEASWSETNFYGVRNLTK
jgi:DnaJ family protein B protein 4